MKHLTLSPVERSNWVECSRLRTKPSQEGHVASCLETIAESKFEPHHELRAIESGGRIVGMLAYCPEVDEPVDESTDGLFWIFRLVIDESHQGRGLGRAAMRACVAEIRARGGRLVRTMCKPANVAAARCYESIGFARRGHLDDGDVLFELELEGALDPESN